MSADGTFGVSVGQNIMDKIIHCFNHVKLNYRTNDTFCPVCVL